MRWRGWRWVALGGFVLALGVALGCTNSEELNSGVDRLEVQVEAVNTTTRFGVASFLVNQMTVRPLDPNASDALGANPIALLASIEGGIDIDLNGTATMFQATSPLNVGTYRVESVVLQNLLFQQGVPENPMGCVGAIANYTQVGRVEINQFGGDVVFDVALGSGGNQLSVVIDGAALADAFEASWSCSFSLPNCPIGQMCASSFRTFDFTSRSSTYLQFE